MSEIFLSESRCTLKIVLHIKQTKENAKSKNENKGKTTLKNVFVTLTPHAIEF
jgi:hypothetical protein